MNATRNRDELLILGHRGAPKAAVENTLAAFRAALAEGADGTELDVRLARCGTLVVGHDHELSRFTGRATRVRTSSAWALGLEDLGGGEGLPTLDAVLAVMRGKVVNVEVKADDGDPVALARAVAASARKWRGNHRRFIVSSFEPKVLVALRELAPEVDRGLLIDPDPNEKRRALSMLSRVAPKAIHPHWTEGEHAVRRWRQTGYEVHVWTVNEPEIARALADAGANSVITNHPGALRAALARDAP